MSDPSKKNRRTALIVTAVVVGMIGMSYAFVPLYNMLCKLTGLDGTPKINVIAGPKEVLERSITVKFDANTERGMPWHFAPVKREVSVRLGENLLVEYEAKNNGDEIIAGTALYNITPPKAAKYFHKMQCFCFNEQTLKPGQEVFLPINFYVNPDLDKDPDLKDLKSITLSYTFFRMDSPALDKAMEDFYNQPSAQTAAPQ